jgi:uroporphyrin-III C-methyltransferase
MARKHAGDIAQALIAGGRKNDEPAAIVANAARPDQTVIVTSLEKLGEAAAESPAVSIIVIGENVRLREQLNWLARNAAAFNPA